VLPEQGAASHLAELRQVVEDPVERNPGLIIHRAIMLVPVFQPEVKGDNLEGRRAAWQVEHKPIQVFQIVRIFEDLQRQKAKEGKAREPFAKPV
jgi:hypothetical protein